MSVSDPSPAAALSPEKEADDREVPTLVLVILAFIVGAVAAFGAIFFKVLISLIYNLAFYGTFNYDMNPNAYGPPSPLGPLIILVPVIGGLIVVYLVKTFAPEAKGHGVPEVMYAIYHQDGNVRGIVAVVKSLASALSIGTGASVGREGPIIQIGASFGSTLGRALGLIRSQKITLLSAGAGAGIAATFNTPLGGVLFASEILLPEISTRSFLPVVVATATSTYVYRMVMGAESTFLVTISTLPQMHSVNLAEIVFAAITGLAMGVAAWMFVKLLAYAEDWFEGLPVNVYLQNVLGMITVGAMGYAFLLATGHYQVLSVGYATIQNILNNGDTAILLLLLFFFGKLVATCVSLGSGASGGIFSPCLFMGASLGGAIGAAGKIFFPDSGLSIPTFAIIGMGAMVGGSTSAAMTAIVMIFEMTRDYNIIVPLVLAVALAVGVRRSLVASDIYTIKLRKRGHPIPTDRTTNMFLVQPVTDVMSTKFVVLPAATSIADVLDQVETRNTHVLVTDGQRLAGFVRFADIPYSASRQEGQTLGDVMSNAFVLASEKSNLNELVTRMNRRKRFYGIVIQQNRGVPRGEDVVGVIARAELANAVVVNHYS